MIFATWFGWSLLLTGTAVSGIFAAFGFAVSVFEMPTMLDDGTGALTTMGVSMSLVWNNLPVMLTWGAIVVGPFVASVLSGVLGLIVIFPLLGHGTWNAYRAIRTSRSERVYYFDR